MATALVLVLSLGIVAVSAGLDSTPITSWLSSLTSLLEDELIPVAAVLAAAGLWSVKTLGDFSASTDASKLKAKVVELSHLAAQQSDGINSDVLQLGH